MDDIVNKDERENTNMYFINPELHAKEIKVKLTVCTER